FLQKPDDLLFRKALLHVRLLLRKRTLLDSGWPCLQGAGHGRAALERQTPTKPSEQAAEQDLCFDLSEGAVLQQAIASTRELVCEARPALKQRIWLYRAEASAGSTKRGNITCLDSKSLNRAIQAVIQRHNLLGDDGLPLRLNLSRLRKSRFDRALRTADGDIAITANLMGNTPRVAH
ncbi:hypothetical protein, partial [Burkholderia vietnamiensis]